LFDGFVAFQARILPESIAVLTPEGAISFAQFDGDVSRFACHLQGLSVCPDEAVAVEVRDPYLRWVLILALARLGIASAPAHDTTAAFKLTERGEDARGPRTLHISAEWIASAMRRSPKPIPRARPHPDALGHVLLSSGTTGDQKRIGLGWSVIDAIVRNAPIAYGARSPGRWLVLTGADTALGFALPLSCWANGNSVILGTEGKLSTGLLMRLQPTLIGCTPSQLQDLLSTLPQNFSPIPSLRIVTAGSAVPPALAQQARLRFAGDIRSVYGASECSAAAIADGALLERHPGAAGYPMPGVDIEIVDDAGQAVSPGKVGEIRIRSNRVVGRYLDNSERSTFAFRDGWFHPGDLGRMRDDGLLLVEGRVDELMNLGGEKVLPSLIEQVALRCRGVADAAAFSVPDATGLEQCWIALVPEEGFEPDELARRVRCEVPWLHSLTWVSTGVIPRNPGGKIGRAQLREACVRSAVRREAVETPGRAAVR
jgi:2,3-dihydroxybenzoate-AMP ligase